MCSWKIAPGHYWPAADEFLKSGAPMPDELTMIGRWHAPGSVSGWLLVEAKGSRPLYEHAAQRANLLKVQVTPIGDDSEAAQARSRVYEK